MFGILRAIRRRKYRRLEFPSQWYAILEEKVPFYQAYSDEQRERFCTLVKIFVWEKHFIGAQGMEITDEVKVVIAASACRLILNLGIKYYNRLTEIVVYPYVYTHPDQEGVIYGEAHAWGTVVLSWPAVMHGIQNPYDGEATGAHEFAHVLDRADGVFDGTPLLRTGAAYGPWVRVMSRHFLALQKRNKKQRKVLRMYGATNEAEFFAVATESYFEKPEKMKRLTPELYQVMLRFYGPDLGSSSQDNPDSDQEEG
ncbi:MAG: zinc-dependent peptidase [Deltaproteobacteria bacterium]|nr:zinc-dependent peptidase [Deltaproteobacteria bacterium]